MIGSVCYPRHSIVEDRVSGICKQGSLKKLFDVMDVSASETGTPGAVMYMLRRHRLWRHT